MLHDHPTLMAKMREDDPVRGPMPANSKRVAARMSCLCKDAVVHEPFVRVPSQR